MITALHPKEVKCADCKGTAFVEHQLTTGSDGMIDIEELRENPVVYCMRCKKASAWNDALEDFEPYDEDEGRRDPKTGEVLRRAATRKPRRKAFNVERISPEVRYTKDPDFRDFVDGLVPILVGATQEGLVATDLQLGFAVAVNKLKEDRLL